MERAARAAVEKASVNLSRSNVGTPLQTPSCTATRSKSNVCGNVLQPGTHACSHPLCGRVETRRHEFRRCSCCGRTRYCSRSCQSLDWRLQHQFACLPLLELYGWIESDTESQDTATLGVHGGGGDDDEAPELASGASSDNLAAMPDADAAAAR